MLLFYTRILELRIARDRYSLIRSVNYKDREDVDRHGKGFLANVAISFKFTMASRDRGSKFPL